MNESWSWSIVEAARQTVTPSYDHTVDSNRPSCWLTDDWHGLLQHEFTEKDIHELR